MANGTDRWSVIKSAVELAIKDLKLDVSEDHKVALKLLVNQGVSPEKAEGLESDLNLPFGSGEIYKRLLTYIASKDFKGTKEQKTSLTELWDNIAVALKLTQPEDSKYVVIERE